MTTNIRKCASMRIRCERFICWYDTSERIEMLHSYTSAICFLKKHSTMYLTRFNVDKDSKSRAACDCNVNICGARRTLSSRC